MKLVLRLFVVGRGRGVVFIQFYPWAVQYSEESISIHVFGCIKAQGSIGYLTIHAEHQKDAHVSATLQGVPKPLKKRRVNHVNVTQKNHGVEHNTSTLPLCGDWGRRYG